MTIVIREYELTVTVRVALRTKPYGSGKWPFTPTSTEISEAVTDVLKYEEAITVERPKSGPRLFERDHVNLDIEDVTVGMTKSAPPGVIDEIADAELKRRREQDDIAKHAEQRSVETEEKERDA